MCIPTPSLNCPHPAFERRLFCSGAVHLLLASIELFRRGILLCLCADELRSDQLVTFLVVGTVFLDRTIIATGNA